jgi:hypothetical protein
VVVVDRSVGDIEAKTFATVVAIDGRGSRLVGPDYSSPAFGGALHIERVTGYDRLVGRDGDGAYHLLRRSPGGDRVLEVIAEVGAGPVHEQRIVDDRVLAQWIEHIDDVRGWDEVTSEFEALVGVDRGDGIETDGGHSESGSERCSSWGKSAGDANLGYSEARDDLVCSSCVVYLVEHGHYPDEDCPERSVTVKYELRPESDHERGDGR